MPTTSNFGWTTPADTDLVKDGAAAIRTLGNGIDTSFLDLKGGTTGQVLSKATNADLDYTWITPQVGDITEVAAGTGISGGGTSGSVTITNSMATAIDAKGDLIVGTGSDAFTRLAVGANDTVLMADSTQTGGVKWGTVASGGVTLLSTIDASAATTVSFTSISGSYKHLLLTWNDAGSDSSNTYWAIRVNNDSGTNRHQYRGWKNADGTLTGISNRSNQWGGSTKDAPIGPVEASGGPSSYNGFGALWLYNYADTGNQKFGYWHAFTGDANGGTFDANYASVLYNQNTAITRIDFLRSSTQTITGKFRLFGVS